MSKTLLLSALLISLPLAACDAKKETPTTAGVSADTLALAKSLLRGELAAVATYEDVIKKNDKPGWTARMEIIRDDHKDSAAKLRGRVTALGGAPEASAGAWGGWTELVAKGAAAIGDEAGRTALETGEKNGIASYERALTDPKCDEDTKTLIRNDLLDRTRAHVKTLQELKQ